MRPRFRTVVKPASSVVRQFTTPRSVRYTGESFTPCIGSGSPSGPPGPPMSMLSSMSMSPGSSVTSPRSISVAGLGSSEGFTATIWLPSTTITPGERTSPASTSTQRSARRIVTSLIGSS